MKKSDILKRIEYIKLMADEDNTIAHEKEDSLREDFIKHVATHRDSLGEKAKLILTTNEIDFERWCE